MFQGAALTMALLAAAAVLSGPPANPALDGDYVLATPELLGLSQEEFDRLRLPEGSKILAGDFNSEYPELEPPQFWDYRPPAPALVEGGIVAAQVAIFAHPRWRLAAPLRIGAPFYEELAAGTGFSRLFSESDGSSLCVFHGQGRSFTPAKDDAGEIYPSICLHGEDEEGRFTKVRLRPYNRRRAGPRELQIEPAVLEPLPEAEWDADVPAFTAVRRLRIVRVDAGIASIALENAFEKKRDEGRPEVWATTSNMKTVGSTQLPLQPGASASLGGVTMVALERDGEWHVEAHGAFDPWARLSPNRTGFSLDGGAPAPSN